jgi:hypothetical protein
VHHIPRTHRTPAERDFDVMEASRLRALSLRREAIDAFWRSMRDAARRILHRSDSLRTPAIFHARKEA